MKSLLIGSLTAVALLAGTIASAQVVVSGPVVVQSYYAPVPAPVVTYSPVVPYVPPVVPAPVVTYRPYVEPAPVVTYRATYVEPAPVVTYRATYVEPAPVVAYRPAYVAPAPVVTYRPVAPAAVYYAPAPVYVQPRVLVPGEPVRNFLRMTLP